MPAQPMHGGIISRANQSTKSQTLRQRTDSSEGEQAPKNLQSPNPNAAGRVYFEYWWLEFPWVLVIGVWSFRKRLSFTTNYLTSPPRPKTRRLIFPPVPRMRD